MRRSDSFIQARRGDRRVRFLMTGGTSFVGFHIALELLARGHEVAFLCRPRDSRSAAERMQRRFRWAGIGRPERASAVEGWIDKPRCGLDDQAYAALIERADEIIHCASDTSFMLEDEAAVRHTNIEGTRNALELAQKSGCYFFHQVSTAYVAGKRTDTCPEEHVAQSAFHNAYEESKHTAERLALDACAREGIRLNIYRPSIIYGDSRTGRALKFNALYYPLKVLVWLMNKYRKDIAENGGRLAERMGVRPAEGGTLLMPIRFETSEGAVFNPVPIDFVASAFVAIMEKSLAGDVFHIVAGESTITLEEVLDHMMSSLEISGLRTATVAQLEAEKRSPLEKLFDNYIEVYKPYLRDRRSFASHKADAILEPAGIRPPFLSREIFARCLRCAIEADWGKALFAETQAAGAPAASQDAPGGRP